MARPLRLALISEHASPHVLLGGEDAGGQNVYVDEVARSLAQRGHSVDIFTRRDSTALPEVIQWAPGVRIVNLAAGPCVTLPKDDLWRWMPAFHDAFLRFMAREGLGGSVERAYDVLHGNFWMSGWVAARLRCELGIPAVQLFHALGTTKRRHQGEADTSPTDRIATERAVIHAVDRVIAQCPSERAELIVDYGTPPEKIALIPGAVNTERFRPIPRDQARQRIGLGLAPDDFVIAYVGRLLPRKDIRNIVRAVAALVRRTARPVKLLVIGGSTPEPDPIATPEIGALRALAAELGVADRVICTGRRQPDELRDYYGAGDVMVTTPWYEPFGLTPLEAMACGRPVIGAAVGGITATVSHGVTGFLVPPRDPAALARQLTLLLDRPDLRARLGAAARARAVRDYTWPTVAARLTTLYDDLAGQPVSAAVALTADD